MSFVLTSYIIALSLFVNGKTEILSKEEGEVCKELAGEAWTCQHIKDCPQVGDFKRNHPVICNFHGVEPIICCPPNPGVTEESIRSPGSGTDPPEVKAEDNPPSPDDVTTSFIPRDREPPPSANNGPDSSPFHSIPISMRKCIEYGVKLCHVPQVPFLKPDTSTRLVRDVGFHRVVVGGVEAEEKQWPFMVAIGYGEEDPVSWDCGGSVISERWIISAAHCAQSSVGSARWAAMGTLDLEYIGIDQAVPIIEIVVHPTYKQPTIYNDIALLKLEYDVIFNVYVRPVCLHNFKVITDNVTSAGWGTTGFGAPKSSKLLFVDLQTVKGPSCKKLYGTSYLIPRGLDDDTMICAGSAEKDSCSGDSGGPLFFRSPMCLNFQIGVVSFGRRCGDLPGVYTRISAYIPWIESVVWPQKGSAPEPEIPRVHTRSWIEPKFAFISQPQTKVYYV